MSYRTITIPPFDKQLKRLAKKFPSLKVEYAKLVESIEVTPFLGVPLGNSCYKIRIAIKSKGKGKSGGGRVIINIQVVDQNIFLLAIYDKSEQEDITTEEIKYLLSFIDR